jgi:hypothetical protein
MTSMDQEVIDQYLDNARLHSDTNEWAEGYWIGRAISHAEQNAVNHEWLIESFEERGLDAAVVAIPKGDALDPTMN